MMNEKGKDSDPRQTIHRIRGILYDLGISTRESAWFHQIEPFYSLALRIGDTNIGTNGKGTSVEYALASAYAELMERIQNLILFNKYDFSRRDIEHKGFRHAPDEIYINLADLDNPKNQIPFLLPQYSLNIIKQMMNLIGEVSLLTRRGKHCVVPFFCVNDLKTAYAPVELITNCYGSIGMCAGNTPEEALVQGISEILERYSLIQIIYQRITPPTLPEAFIRERMPRIHEMMTSISEEISVDIVIKDCSLGKELPVLAAIYTIPETERYWIKFGAHPVMEIAAERTLTEFLQGRTVDEFRSLDRLEFSLFEKYHSDTYSNIWRHMIDGWGYYPKEVFLENPSYSFNLNDWKAYTSNSEMLHALLNLLMEMGHRIFIRNNSFLQFPTFRIIIPGMSDFMTEPDALNHVSSNIQSFVKAYRILKSLPQAARPDLETLIAWIDDTNGEMTVHRLFRRLFSTQFYDFYKISPSWLKSNILFKLGRFREAYEAMDKFIVHLKKEDQEEADLAVFRCARDVMGARAQGLSDSQIESLLTLFFDKEIVRHVLEQYEDPDNVLSDMPCFPCWNCSECEAVNLCSYPSFKPTFLRIKELQAQNAIDQMKLKEIVDVS